MVHRVRPVRRRRAARHGDCVVLAQKPRARLHTEVQARRDAEKARNIAAPCSFDLRNRQPTRILASRCLQAGDPDHRHIVNAPQL